MISAYKVLETCDSVMDICFYSTFIVYSYLPDYNEQYFQLFRSHMPSISYTLQPVKRIFNETFVTVSTTIERLRESSSTETNTGLY